MAAEMREPARVRGLEAVSTARAVWRFFRTWPVLPIFLLGTVTVCAIFAPLIAPYDHVEQDLRSRNAPPAWFAKGSTKHLLGADQVGRDILSRTLYGARISMLVAGTALCSGVLVGTGLGLLAGYFGGIIDEVVMRIVDVWLALPFLLVALVVAVVLGQSLATITGLLALAAWSTFVRNVRAEVLSLKTRDYVAMAKVADASTGRILIRHILPGVMGTITVIATLRVGGLILTEASLSYLGAGLPSPTPAWGLMVAEGQKYLINAWWVALFPGMAIFIVVMSFNFLGDWMRDRFDPKLRQMQ